MARVWAMPPKAWVDAEVERWRTMTSARRRHRKKLHRRAIRKWQRAGADMGRWPEFCERYGPKE